MSGGTSGTGWPHRPVRTADAWPAPTEAAAEPVAPPPPPPPPPVVPPQVDQRAAWLVALGLVLALALAGAGVGDWLWRNRELATLLDAIEVSEASMALPNNRLARVLFPCDDPGDDECDLDEAQRIAEAGLPGLQLTGARVAAVEVTSFHPAIVELRERYLEHSRAWQSYLALVASEPARGVDAPRAISTTFDAAGEAALDALPPLARGGARGRVERIFEL